MVGSYHLTRTINVALLMVLFKHSSVDRPLSAVSMLRSGCGDDAGLVARNLSVSAGNTGDGVKTEKEGLDFGKIVQSGLRGPLTEALAAYYVVRISQQTTHRSACCVPCGANL